MLRVAKARLKAKSKKFAPKKPPAPEHWGYDRGFIVEFFWAWHNSDYDQKLTPDGKPWQDQDPHFWDLVEYMRELYRWAEYRAEHPRRMPHNAVKMDQL